MELLSQYPLLLAPAIFLARVTDVSLGTLRTILVFRGHALVGAGIGFVEVLIWVTAAANVINNLGSWYLLVAYAGGFAVGNIVGSRLELKIGMGNELVRAVSRDPDVNLADTLRGGGYSVVEVLGRADSHQPVEVLLVVERRRRVPALLELIHRVDPGAVTTISDVKPYVPRMLAANASARWQLRRVGKWK